MGQRVTSREHRAKSIGHRAEGIGQRVTSREQRAKSIGHRAEGKGSMGMEQRARGIGFIFLLMFFGNL